MVDPSLGLIIFILGRAMLVLVAVAGSPHISSSFLCVSGFPGRYEKNPIMTCVVATGLVYLFN
jgi:hypothetical protein